MPNWKRYLGVIFIAVAWLCWGLIPVFAFFNISIGLKAAITASLLVLSEVFNYLGIIFIGKEIWIHYKDRFKFWKWFRKRE